MDSGFVPIEAITKAIACPICFEIPKSCQITTCGHSFCEFCIKESINLKHQCPVCNSELENSSTLIPNRAVQDLVENTTHATVEADTRYTRLLVGCASGGASMSETGDPNLSPIEKVFVNHLQHALTGYQSYFERLKASYNIGTENFPVELASHQSGNAESKDPIEYSVSLRKFQRAADLLVEDYKLYLDSLPKSPFLVPSLVHITVPSKHLRFDQQLLPTYFPSQVFAAISKQFQSVGDEVLSFGEDCAFFLTSSGNSAARLKLDHTENADTIFSQSPAGRVESGSTITVEGTIQLKSEQRRPCFAKRFDPQKLRTLTYFACQTCNMNWICDSCSKSCHDNHALVIHIANHKPTWACCYCSRNKNICQIYDATFL